MQILPRCNGGAEGAICHFMALYGKVLAPLNSQQLLPRAQLFVLPELTAAPATADGKNFIIFFFTESDGARSELRSHLVLRPSGWMGTLDRCSHWQSEIQALRH